jgi:hypothetical protein
VLLMVWLVAHAARRNQLDVCVLAGECVPTIPALATGLLVRGAVQRGSELPRHHCLSRTFRPCKQPGMRGPLRIKGPLQSRQRDRMADNGPHDSIVG